MLLQNYERIVKSIVSALRKGNIIGPATSSTIGLLSAADKTELDILVNRPVLSITDSAGINHTDILNLKFPDFKVTDNGFRSATIESSSYKYPSPGFMTEHIVSHNLNTMDLNVTIRTKDLESEFYSITYANIEFLNPNVLKVSFTRAENPSIFVSKM